MIQHRRTAKWCYGAPLMFCVFGAILFFANVNVAANSDIGPDPVDAYRFFHTKAAEARSLEDVVELMPSRYPAERLKRYQVLKQKRPQTPSYDEMQKQTFRMMHERYTALKLITVKEATNGRFKREKNEELAMLEATVQDARSGQTYQIVPVMELENGKWKYIGDRQVAAPPEVQGLFNGAAAASENTASPSGAIQAGKQSKTNF